MITYFGLNNRDHILVFQEFLFKSLISSHPPSFDQTMSTCNLGKNLSAFICEKNNKKLLVILDADDGCGGTPADCKIVWSALDEIQRRYRPDDMMMLDGGLQQNKENTLQNVLNKDGSHVDNLY